MAVRCLICVTVAVMAVLLQAPVAWWALLPGLLFLPLVAWFEWRGRWRLTLLDYLPGQVQLHDAGGQCWRLDKQHAAVCYPLFITLQVSRGRRVRWATLFRDQMPAEHWRQLRVVLRWR